MMTGRTLIALSLCLGAAAYLQSCTAGSKENGQVVMKSQLPAGASGPSGAAPTATTATTAAATPVAETPAAAAPATPVVSSTGIRDGATARGGVEGSMAIFGLPKGTGAHLTSADSPLIEDPDFAKVSVDVAANSFSKDVQVRIGPSISGATIETANLLGVEGVTSHGPAVLVGADPTAFTAPITVNIPVRSATALTAGASFYALVVTTVRTPTNGKLIVDILDVVLDVTGTFASVAISGPASVEIVSFSPFDPTTRSVIAFNQDKPANWEPTSPLQVWQSAVGDAMTGPVIGLSTVLGAQLFDPRLKPSKVCTDWTRPAMLGDDALPDIEETKEVGGIFVWQDFLYGVVDGTLYVMNQIINLVIMQLNGALKQIIQVSGVMVSDVEAMSKGPCPSDAAKTCAYVFDVGDNQEKRDGSNTTDRAWPQIVVVELAEEMPSEVPAAKVIKVNMGKRDTIAGAIHPISGDAFFVTKSLTPGLPAPRETLVLRVKRADMIAAAADTVLVAEQLGKIDLMQLKTPEFSLFDLPKIAANIQRDIKTFDDISVEHPSVKPLLSKAASDLAISPDGKRFIVATYASIFEFGFDLSSIATSADWPLITDPNTFVKQRDYTIIAPPNPLLKQQEAATYVTDRDILVTTEHFKGAEAPILRTTATACP